MSFVEGTLSSARSVSFREFFVPNDDLKMVMKSLDTINFPKYCLSKQLNLLSSDFELFFTFFMVSHEKINYHGSLSRAFVFLGKDQGEQKICELKARWKKLNEVIPLDEMIH